MKKILLIGAGRSATVLINYLVRICNDRKWQLCVAEQNVEVAKEKVGENDWVEVVELDVTDQGQVAARVDEADLVISMVPARFHDHVASVCLERSKHLITASYLSEEVKKLAEEAKAKGLIFLNECGLDPGIDHMSAMREIDNIRESGGVITGFETFTGGLLAPTEDDNPWKYKFTWNPRNVVMAGTGTVKFLQQGRYKFIPYHRLFRRTELVHIPKYGYFEGYANRDSLKYLHLYQLEGIKTMFRGTFRKPGFCKAWDIFVQLGATDDSYQLPHVDKMTHRQFINSFLSYNPHDSIELKLAHYLRLDIEGDEMFKLKWLGIFSDELVGLEQGTPAQVLEHILKKKWTLTEQDRDMIVMWHKFNYEIDGAKKEKNATLVSIGDNAQDTAMAKTVGLPMGIAAKLILEGVIKTPGVHLPISREIYDPILNELISDYDFDFIEEQIS